MSTSKIEVVDLVDLDLFTCTEEQLRAWYDREGMDYDQTGARGLELIKRLGAEHRARADQKKARQS